MLCKVFPSVSSVVLNINILQSIEVKNSGIMTTLVSGPINLQQSGPDKGLMFKMNCLITIFIGTVD